MRLFRRKHKCGQRCGHCDPRPQARATPGRYWPVHIANWMTTSSVCVGATPKKVADERRRDNAAARKGRLDRVCAALRVVRFVGGSRKALGHALGQKGRKDS